MTPRPPSTPPSPPPSNVWLPQPWPRRSLSKLDYQPHHLHHHPLPRGDANSGSSPNNSPSPPLISFFYYYPFAPHVIIALSHGLSVPLDANHHSPISATINPGSTPCSTLTAASATTPNSLNYKKKMQKRDEDDIKFAVKSASTIASSKFGCTTTRKHSSKMILLLCRHEQQRLELLRNKGGCLWRRGIGAATSSFSFFLKKGEDDK